MRAHLPVEGFCHRFAKWFWDLNMVSPSLKGSRVAQMATGSLDSLQAPG